jgi:SAM-dependent methyltransferase
VNQSSIDVFDAPEARYDVVMGHGIAHLLESKESAIAKVRRLLKPGGVFVSSTACLKGQIPLPRFIPSIESFLGPPPMVKFFSAKELESELTAAGFRMIGAHA